MNLDHSLFHAINGTCSTPLLDGLMRALTSVGEYSWLVLLVAPVGWARGGPRFRFFCMVLLPVILISDSLPNLLKLLIGRDRPFVTFPDANILVDVARLRDFGFPSNHACNSFAVATLVALNFGRRAAGVALAPAFLVAFSRVYVGAHYPGDVAAGAALGAVIAAASQRLLERAATPRARAAIIAGLIALGLLIQLTWRLLRGF